VRVHKLPAAEVVVARCTADRATLPRPALPLWVQPRLKNLQQTAYKNWSETVRLLTAQLLPGGATNPGQ